MCHASIALNKFKSTFNVSHDTDIEIFPINDVYLVKSTS